jgi:hypothetical protein
MPALQIFECLVFGIEAETFGHDHLLITFDATAVANWMGFKCFLSVGHAHGQTVNRYPDSYGKLAAMH